MTGKGAKNGRDSVHNRRSPDVYTHTGSDTCVHKLRENPGTRELRRNLTAYLTADRPAVVMNHDRAVALVVPIPKHDRWDEDQRLRARRETKKRAGDAIELAFPDV